MYREKSNEIKYSWMELYKINLVRKLLKNSN